MASIARSTVALLQSVPRLTLSSLKNTPNAERVAPRPRGRTNGNYCGYGNNGQKAKGKTSKHYIGFEGGQTPFYRVVPRHGKINQESDLKYHSVSIEKILLWIDQGRIDPSKKITMKVLRDSKCVPKTVKRDGVHLLGTGKVKLTIPLDIEVSRATGAAIEAVEKAGGKLMCTYYDPVTMRYHLWEDKYAERGRREPIRPLPSRARTVRYYADEKHNGYLSTKGDAHLLHTPEQFQRWQARHVVRSKIWQQNPEWSVKREEWAAQGLIPTAEEKYDYETPGHWSNYQSPVSRYFGANPDLLPGKTELVPGQLHVGSQAQPKEALRARADKLKKAKGPKRVNPNAPYRENPYDAN